MVYESYTPWRNPIKDSFRRSLAIVTAFYMQLGRALVRKTRRGVSTMGRALILWLLGVPVSVIVLVALFTSFI
jgi:hypothetical protein